MFLFVSANFPKSTSNYFFFFAIVTFRPILADKSVHTDFVVQAKCPIFWLNRAMRIYLDLNVLNFQKKIFKKVTLL